MVTIVALTLLTPQMASQMDPQRFYPDGIYETFNESETTIASAKQPTNKVKRQTQVYMRLMFTMSPTAIRPDTPYVFQVGNWTLRGKISDDPAFKSGSKKATFYQGTTIGAGIQAVHNSLTLTFDETRVWVSLNGSPKDGASVVADAFLKLPNPVAQGRIIPTLKIGNAAASTSMLVQTQRVESAMGPNKPKFRNVTVTGGAGMAAAEYTPAMPDSTMSVPPPAGSGARGF